MKLAASNIGWGQVNRAEVLPRLPRHGIKGLVIAPTMVFPEGPHAKPKDVAAFRQEAEKAGLAVVAIQSLTFNLPGAALFGDSDQRRVLAEHLKRQAELAGKLGAGSLIFGSPGLRQGTVDPGKAIEIFGEVAGAAADNNTKLCIEPLSSYGNEFVTTTQEGVQLVRDVNHPGFGLHLDAAAIAGAGEKPDVVLRAASEVGITSFDASAPELMPLSRDLIVPHGRIADALRAVAYDGYVSLEMRQPNDSNPVESYFSEIDFMREQYS